VALNRSGHEALPTREAGDSVKPGVKRSETPGKSREQMNEPVERAAGVSFPIDSRQIQEVLMMLLRSGCRPFHGLYSDLA